MVIPFILLFLMMALPESPRWHILKARRLERKDRHENCLRVERQYEAAFQSLCRLRNSKVQAARDMFHIDAWIALTERPAESASSGATHTSGRRAHGPLKAWFSNTLDLFRDDRCRRAMTAGLIVMSLQQLCGVNVLAYYSSSVFKDSLPDCKQEINCVFQQDKIALKVCLIRELEASSCSCRSSTP